jgi:spore germination protein KC
MFKKISVIIIIFPIIVLTGCWSGNEVNTLAITACIGIDKVEKGYLVTDQVINPKAIASKRVTNESPVYLYSTEGVDLDETIRRLTTQSSRKIYNAHLRMVVFGENIAKDGIKDILDYFLRNYQYRTDFYFVVAKDTTAHEVLSVLTPLDTIPGIEMYNSLKISSEEWASTNSIRIIELVNSIIADGKNPVITGIEITSSEINTKSTEALKQNHEPNKLLYASLGAFKKDKLVGWLDEDESKGYKYITGNVKSTVGYAYYGDKVKISSEVLNAKSVIKASLVNGKPDIDVEINAKINVKAIDGEFDISKEENKKRLIEIDENKIKLFCNKVVSKAQKDLKTDIFGFGEAIHRKYPEMWAKIKDNWNNEFVDLPVSITVKVKINQIGQITKPFFIKE